MSRERCGAEGPVKLIEALPVFSAELRTCLSAIGRGDIAAQVEEIVVERYSYDGSCSAANIYLQSPRSLNNVETNIIGLRHGETIEVEHPYWVNVDIDNFGRLKGIELLNGTKVADTLSRIFSH